MNGEPVDYAASAGRFINPTGHYRNKTDDFSASHPVLESLDRQSRYYTLSGKSQRSASLPSLRLLGSYSYRGTGIAPGGAVSGAWHDGFSHSTHNFLAGIGITCNVTGLYTNRLKADGLEKQAESTRFLRS